MAEQYKAPDEVFVDFCTDPDKLLEIGEKLTSPNILKRDAALDMLSDTSRGRLVALSGGLNYYLDGDDRIRETVYPFVDSDLVPTLAEKWDVQDLEDYKHVLEAILGMRLQNIGGPVEDLKGFLDDFKKELSGVEIPGELTSAKDVIKFLLTENPDNIVYAEEEK